MWSNIPAVGMETTISTFINILILQSKNTIIRMLNTHFSGLVQLVYFVFCLLANMPNRLQCLNVPIVSDEDCEKAYPGMITRRMVCAGYMDGGRDACNVRTAANERRHRCALAHTPSMCLTGRLRQPPGVFRRSPWPGVVGSGVCRSRIPRSLRQSVRIPLLDQ